MNQATRWPQRSCMLMLTLLISFSGLFASVFSGTVHAAGTTYYVDSALGNDGNSGTSSSSPWKSLSKVNEITFVAGDKILFKAGGVWNGQLWPKGSGTSGNPIVIDQYGSGNKPIINGLGTSYPAFVSGAVMLYNQEHWEINDLEVTNYSSSVTSARAGILIYNSGTGLKNHIYIKNCYVHDVNSDPNGLKITGGIIVYGENIDLNGDATQGEKGYNDVLVENNHVANVTKEGIRTATGSTAKNNTNIIFRGNFVEEIFGDGMVLSGMVSGGVMEYNIIRNHSKTNTANYAGLWTYYTNGAIVQYNEVYGGTGGFNDGEAFDSDLNTDGDVFQYNYSHNNRGGLILVMPSAKNLIFRYNISEGDGRGSNTEIFHYPNSSPTNYIYNNTIYLAPDNNQYYIFNNNTAMQPKFFNNIIKADGTVAAFSKSGAYGAGADFRNNLFYPSTIDDVNGPPSHPGLVTAEPMLTNPGAGVSDIDMTNPNKLPGYKLQAGSPAINSGISISGNGGKDFYGNPVYSGPADIGAHEFQGSSSSSSPAFHPVADAYVRDGSYANANFGTESVLTVKTDTTGYSRKAYAKFDYSAYSGTSASSAKIRLNVSGVNTDAARTIKVYGTTDESWTETGITWNNAPAGTTYIGSIAVSNSVGLWHELDVTSYINSQMSDKKVSFLFVNEGVGSPKSDVDFTSREAASDNPQLVIN